MVVGKWTRVRYLNHLVLIYFWRRQVDSTTWYLRETGFEDFPHMFYFEVSNQIGKIPSWLEGSVLIERVYVEPRYHT
jgi:hypothetical protein